MPPHVIHREGHRISRKQIKLSALRTLYRLHENGFTAYLVGGCVRDLLMGRTPKDFDIATDARPGQIKRLFNNCRLIGRRFRLAHLQFKDGILEVSTFRAAAPENEIDGEGAPSPRHPLHLKNEEGMVLRDNVFGTPEEDALRRDFTINALAYNIADFSVIDFTTGLSDLEERLIRPIGDPRVRFTEDPVRMLRAVRFAASHELKIESSTWETLCELSSTITRSSPERLYEEIQKLFLLGSAVRSFELLERSGLSAALFPGLSQRAGGDSPTRERLHANLEALDGRCKNGTPPSPALFLALLLGPVLEEEALARCGAGIAPQQALKEVCSEFLEAQCNTVNIPGRIGRQMSALMALQPALQRRSPRRPGRLANHPEFAEALEYLRMTAKTSGQHRIAVEWWDAFLSRASATPGAESPATSAPKKRRRRRRHRSRPAVQVAV